MGLFRIKRFVVALPAAENATGMRVTKNTLLFSFLLLLSFCLHQYGYAQCTTGISSFPYDEDFENTDGNWVPNTNLHWQWCGPSTPAGPISKPVITGPGGGLRCWIAGGPNGSSYAGGSSFLQSPCFDFSTLVNPEISFKIFWETEKSFDGAKLEFSLDGINWTIVGSENSNSTCQGTNWYNYTPVRYISFTAGWSGNIQTSGGGGGNCVYGSGSGAWVDAKHTLSSLAGQNSVIFRFTFGAGTQCNDFDGFAIDDIHVGEAAPNFPDFAYACGTNNSVSFTNNSSACTLLWNFGDPASGTADTSTLANPVHIFSSPGTYTVNLTGTYSTGTPPPKTEIITILGVSTAVTTPVKCNGSSTGAVAVNVSGGSGLYNYTWNTTPVQTTPAINNLPANAYSVTVSSNNACTVTATVNLTEPSILGLAPVASPAKCGNDNGTVLSNVSGGTIPYLFSWSNAETSVDIANLAAGLYDISVEDANGCVAAVNGIEVTAVTYTVPVSLGNDVTICPGQTLILRPGTFASYKWQDNSTAPTFTVTATGTYSVQVTDTEGCTGSGSIKVTVDCKDIYFPSAFTPNADLLNPGFGPVGDLASLKKFNMVVYNRYGQAVFTSSDPFTKWDGTIRGKAQETQSFVWISTYTQVGRQQQVKKGMITILR